MIMTLQQSRHKVFKAAGCDSFCAAQQIGSVTAGKAWETPFGDYLPRLKDGSAASTGVAHAVVRLLAPSLTNREGSSPTRRELTPTLERNLTPSWQVIEVPLTDAEIYQTPSVPHDNRMLTTQRALCTLPQLLQLPLEGPLQRGGVAFVLKRPPGRGAEWLKSVVGRDFFLDFSAVRRMCVTFVAVSPCGIAGRSIIMSESGVLFLVQPINAATSSSADVMECRSWQDRSAAV